MTSDIVVKGIVLSSSPQAEYNKRIVLLTDRLGKITAFAQSAAKTGSRLIGKLRPMTAAEFRLSKGRSAYNIHGVELMDSFYELSTDLDASLYGSYFLEAAAYYAQEGMVESEARSLLNLVYLSLAALRKKELEPRLIRAIFELRLLVIEGEYREAPLSRKHREELMDMWAFVTKASLSHIYDRGAFRNEELCREFINEERAMASELMRHDFRSVKLLE